MGGGGSSGLGLHPCFEGRGYKIKIGGGNGVLWTFQLRSEEIVAAYLK